MFSYREIASFLDCDFVAEVAGRKRRRVKQARVYRNSNFSLWCFSEKSKHGKNKNVN